MVLNSDIIQYSRDLERAKRMNNYHKVVQTNQTETSSNNFHPDGNLRSILYITTCTYASCTVPIFHDIS